MICPILNSYAEPVVRSEARKTMAAARIPLTRQALAACKLCAHQCGVNRLGGERGRCRAGADARVFSAQIEVGDELELLPTFAIAWSGCDLRCAFCLTHEASWNPSIGARLKPEELSVRATRALATGVRTVMFLGGEPTVHLLAVLETVARLPDEAPLVWKTNAHASAQARALMAGLFDIWVADYKFGNPDCARRLAGIGNYETVVRENLLWASDHSDLIIRHVLLPGHVECCWEPMAHWLSTHLPDVKVSLLDSYWPTERLRLPPELHRTIARHEKERAWDIARECHLNLIECNP
ncbi:MAG: radical SAM protein [Candidatus Omnitrophica bacterium]|nr:radical SAM protein [Candidatus Omnitrophota bacterium]